MDIREAEILARQLIRKHGLEGWTFSWDAAKTRFGACHFSSRRIQLSRPLVELNDHPTVRDVILHEIAHALAYRQHGARGHGRIWKMICVQIGARPERCYSSRNVKTPLGKWILRHRESGEVFRTYHRCPERSLERVEQMWIRGRKAATFGKLEIVPTRPDFPTPLDKAARPRPQAPSASAFRWVLRQPESDETSARIHAASDTRVFVDPLFFCRSRNGGADRAAVRFGHRWCHMWCDPGDEEILHTLAHRIGMRREWFQDRDGFPHYDLLPDLREKALKHGAVERSLFEWVRRRRIRQAVPR